MHPEIEYITVFLYHQITSSHFQKKVQLLKPDKDRISLKKTQGFYLAIKRTFKKSVCLSHSVTVRSITMHAKKKDCCPAVVLGKQLQCHMQVSFGRSAFTARIYTIQYQIKASSIIIMLEILNKSFYIYLQILKKRYLSNIKILNIVFTFYVIQFKEKS